MIKLKYPLLLFSLEESFEYIQLADEYVEYLNHLRLRKILLKEHERKRVNKKGINYPLFF